MKSSLLKGLFLRLAGPGVLTLLLLITSVFGFFIPLVEDSMLQGRKETARELTGTVQTLLQSYADLVPQQASLDEAQSMAITHIQNLRYGPEGKAYFWINDMHPTMIMHPYRLELNGTDLTNFKDENGKRPFVEFVKASKMMERVLWGTAGGGRIPSVLKKNYLSFKVLNHGDGWLEPDYTLTMHGLKLPS